MCALVTGVQTCALPISLSDRVGDDATQRHPDHAADAVGEREQQARILDAEPVNADQERRHESAAGRLSADTEGARQEQQAKHLAFAQELYNGRSEEHTSELQPLMRISYAVFR